jgi:hypothetical protein
MKRESDLIQAAFDDAFSDQIKDRFAALCASVAGGDAPDVAMARFDRGLRQLKEVRKAAAAVVQAIFDEIGE